MCGPKDSDSDWDRLAQDLGRRQKSSFCLARSRVARGKFPFPTPKWKTNALLYYYLGFVAFRSVTKLVLGLFKCCTNARPVSHSASPSMVLRKDSRCAHGMWKIRNKGRRGKQTVATSVSNYEPTSTVEPIYNCPDPGPSPAPG